MFQSAVNLISLVTIAQLLQELIRDNHTQEYGLYGLLNGRFSREWPSEMSY